MSENKTCFVVSPIGLNESETRKRADQVLRHIIEPCVKKKGYSEVIRADKISDPGTITYQIIDQIVNADLVIADLTEHNPNVFYELAVRHATKKPYIQIMDNSWDLPFDVQGIRTIQFNYRDLDSVEDARSQLLDVIDFIHENPDKISTPIHEGLDIESLRKSGSSEDRILGDLAIGIASIQDRLNKIERELHQNNKGSVLYSSNKNRSAISTAHVEADRARRRDINSRKAFDFLEEDFISNKKSVKRIEETE